MLTYNTFGSGKPTFQAQVGVTYLDVSDPSHTLYIQKQIPFGAAWIVSLQPAYPFLDGVESVTGLETDNTDPRNPIVKIAVDGVTITGQGTLIDPLVAVGGSGSSSKVLVPVSAQTNIAKYDVVTSDGFLASTAVPGKRNRTLGFANAAILNTFVGDVVAEGELTNPLWSWTIGLPIFLNGASPSQSCPVTGFTQILGTAIKVDTINVEIHQSILL